MITNACKCPGQACNSIGKRYCDGDAEAGYEIVKMFQGRVRRIVEKVLGPTRKNEREDAIQTAFAHLLIGAKRWKGDCPFCCFLSVVIAHRCIDSLRRMMSDRHVSLPSDDMVPDTTKPLDKELFRRYEAALDELPDDSRNIWRLKMDSIAIAEIARRVGLSERTVYNRLDTVRSFLSRTLADYG